MKTLKNFSIYGNLGLDKESLETRMKNWAVQLEHEKRINNQWYIENGVLNFMCNVDLRGKTIEFPIGLVGGKFLYDGPKTSFYPERIANKNMDFNYPRL